LPHCGKHLGNLLSARAAAHGRAQHHVLRIRSDALLRARTWFHSLGRRQLQTLSPLIVAVAALVVSGTLGAGIPLLVAGRHLEAGDAASASPRGDVQEPSGVFPRADHAAVPKDELAIEGWPGERTAITVSSRTSAFAVEGGGTASGAGVDRGPMTRGEGQSGQGGTSEPPGGSTPGAPVDNEEPSEEAPGEGSEPEAPPEETPPPPAEEPAPPEEQPPPPEEQPTEEQVTICHNAGSPNAKTITVSPSAVAKHLAHGDTLGACP
jgi:hypothetical protein